MGISILPGVPLPPAAPEPSAAPSPAYMQEYELRQQAAAIESMDPGQAAALRQQADQLRAGGGLPSAPPGAGAPGPAAAPPAPPMGPMGTAPQPQGPMAAPPAPAAVTPDVLPQRPPSAPDTTVSDALATLQRGGLPAQPLVPPGGPVAAEEPYTGPTAAGSPGARAVARNKALQPINTDLPPIKDPIRAAEILGSVSLLGTLPKAVRPNLPSVDQVLGAMQRGGIDVAAHPNLVAALDAAATATGEYAKLEALGLVAKPLGPLASRFAPGASEALAGRAVGLGTEAGGGDIAAALRAMRAGGAPLAGSVAKGAARAALTGGAQGAVMGAASAALDEHSPTSPEFWKTAADWGLMGAGFGALFHAGHLGDEFLAGRRAFGDLPPEMQQHMRDVAAGWTGAKPPEAEPQKLLGAGPEPPEATSDFPPGQPLVPQEAMSPSTPRGIEHEPGLVRAYSQEVNDALKDENGQDEIAKALTVPSEHHEGMLGVYDGKVTPGTLTHIDSQDPAVLAAYAAARGIATDQDAQVWLRRDGPKSVPHEQGVGYIVNIPEGWSGETMQAVADRMPKGFGATMGPDGTFVTRDFSGGDPETFRRALYQAVEEVADEHGLGQPHIQLGRFSGAYIPRDSYNGALADRPDVAGLARRLRSERVEPINARWNEALGPTTRPDWQRYAAERLARRNASPEDTAREARGASPVDWAAEKEAAQAAYDAALKTPQGQAGKDFQLARIRALRADYHLREQQMAEMEPAERHLPEAVRATFTPTDRKFSPDGTPNPTKKYGGMWRIDRNTGGWQGFVRRNYMSVSTRGGVQQAESARVATPEEAAREHAATHQLAAPETFSQLSNEGSKEARALEADRALFKGPPVEHQAGSSWSGSGSMPMVERLARQEEARQKPPSSAGRSDYASQLSAKALYAQPTRTLSEPGLKVSPPVPFPKSMGGEEDAEVPMVSAVATKDPDTGRVYVAIGNIHREASDVLEDMGLPRKVNTNWREEAKQGPNISGVHIDGFITNKNRFVDRKTAARLSAEVGGPSGIYSNAQNPYGIGETYELFGGRTSPWKELAMLPGLDEGGPERPIGHVAFTLDGDVFARTTKAELLEALKKARWDPEDVEMGIVTSTAEIMPEHAAEEKFPDYFKNKPLEQQQEGGFQAALKKKQLPPPLKLRQPVYLQGHSDWIIERRPALDLAGGEPDALADGFEYRVTGPEGRHISIVVFDDGPDRPLYVADVAGWGPSKGTGNYSGSWAKIAGTFGVGVVRAVGRQIRADFPEARGMTGVRISGVHQHEPGRHVAEIANMQEPHENAEGVEPTVPGVSKEGEEARPSAVVKEHGYNPESEVMTIRFPSGKVYEYHGVTPEEYAAYEAAESKGKHFGQFIRGRKMFKLPEEPHEALRFKQDTFVDRALKEAEDRHAPNEAQGQWVAQNAQDPWIRDLAARPAEDQPDPDHIRAANDLVAEHQALHAQLSELAASELAMAGADMAVFWKASGLPDEPFIRITGSRARPSQFGDRTLTYEKKEPFADAQTHTEFLPRLFMEAERLEPKADLPGVKTWQVALQRALEWQSTAMKAAIDKAVADQVRGLVVEAYSTWRAAEKVSARLSGSIMTAKVLQRLVDLEVGDAKEAAEMGLAKSPEEAAAGLPTPWKSGAPGWVNPDKLPQPSDQEALTRAFNATYQAQGDLLAGLPMEAESRKRIAAAIEKRGWAQHGVGFSLKALDQLRRGGWAYGLHGAHVKSITDLGRAMMLGTDPRFEAGWGVLTKRQKDGSYIIKGMIHQTARLVTKTPLGSADAKSGGDTLGKVFGMVKGEAAKVGADGYFSIHNHTTWDTTPSGADNYVHEQLANTLRQETGIDFHGSIVLDFDNFTVMPYFGARGSEGERAWGLEPQDRSGPLHVRIPLHGEAAEAGRALLKADPEWEDRALGLKTTSFKPSGLLDLMGRVAAMQQHEGRGLLVGLDPRGYIVSTVLMSKPWLMDAANWKGPVKLEQFMRSVGRGQGAADFVLLAPDKETADFINTKNWDNEHFLGVASFEHPLPGEAKATSYEFLNTGNQRYVGKRLSDFQPQQKATTEMARAQYERLVADEARSNGSTPPGQPPVVPEPESPAAPAEAEAALKDGFGEIANAADVSRLRQGKRVSAHGVLPPGWRVIEGRPDVGYFTDHEMDFHGPGGVVVQIGVRSYDDDPERLRITTIAARVPGVKGYIYGRDYWQQVAGKNFAIMRGIGRWLRARFPKATTIEGHRDTGAHGSSWAGSKQGSAERGRSIAQMQEKPLTPEPEQRPPEKPKGKVAAALARAKEESHYFAEKHERAAQRVPPPGEKPPAATEGEPEEKPIPPSKLRTAVGIWKGLLLTGWQSHGRYAMGNLGQQLLLEPVRRYLHSRWDAAIGMTLPQMEGIEPPTMGVIPDLRGLLAEPLKGSLAPYKGLLTAGADAWKSEDGRPTAKLNAYMKGIARHISQGELALPGSAYEETASKAAENSPAQAFLNTVLAGIHTMNAGALHAAFSAALYDRAVQAVKAKGIERGDPRWPGEVDHALAHPTASDVALAAMLANEMLYLNPNAFSKLFAIAESRTFQIEHPLASTAVNVFAPFRKVPTNAIWRLLDYSPLGVVTGAYKGIRAWKRASLLATHAKEFNKTEQADMIRLINQYKHESARSLSRMTVGLAMLGFGYWLYRKGRATCDVPKTDHLAEAKGAMPFSFLIGDTWYPTTHFGPLMILPTIGACMAQGVDEMKESYEQIQRKHGEKGEPPDLEKLLAGAQGGARGLALQAMNVPFAKGAVEPWAEAKFDPAFAEVESFPSTVAAEATPAGVRQAARAFDPYQRVASTRAQQAATALPWTRQLEPERRDVFGHPLEHASGWRFWLPLGEAYKARSNPLLTELTRLHVEPPAPAEDVKDIASGETRFRLSPGEQEMERQRIGPILEKTLNAVLSFKGPEGKRWYDALDDEQRAALLKETGRAVVARLQASHYATPEEPKGLPEALPDAVGTALRRRRGEKTPDTFEATALGEKGLHTGEPVGPESFAKYQWFRFVSQQAGQPSAHAEREMEADIAEGHGEKALAMLDSMPNLKKVVTALQRRQLAREGNYMSKEDIERFLRYGAPYIERKLQKQPTPATTP